MELPPFVDRLVQPRMPVASDQARALVDSSIARHCKLVEETGILVDDTDFMIDYVGTELAQRWWDLFRGAYPEDETAMGLAFVEEMDGLCDLIEHGRRFDSFIKRQEQPPDEINFTDKIALGLFRAISVAFEADSRRKLHRLTNLIRVPPAFRQYADNQR